LHLLLEHGDFLNINIPLGNVATRLKRGGTRPYCKFTAVSNGDRILKIGKHLAKLGARLCCLVFLTHSVDT